LTYRGKFSLMKFFSRSSLHVILFIISMQFIIASPPDWEDDPNAYEFTATISGAVILNEGVQMGGGIFAAFDDDGNVRGIALELSPPFGPYQGTPVFEMQVRSNDAGDHITFKYYDASEDTILDISEDYTFVVNDIIMDVVDPWILNVGVPDLGCPECSDNDAGVAPFTCALAVASFGCDFLWGGAPISDSCPVSCGSCPVEDECGVCGGSGIPDGECDCDGNVDLGCGCGEAGPSGCDNACGSTLENDECGVCGGSGIPDGECDCDGNVEDCAGVCEGSSILATLCEDTDSDGLGNPGSETEECVDGGRDITDGCELPDLNLFLSADGSVFYNSLEAIGGFQFTVDGATVSIGSGGASGDAGFMVSTGGSMVLAFSFSGATIPAGCGTLVNLSLDGDATGLSGIVVSDAVGDAIPFVYYVGDDTELVADCSDEYPDCAANEFDCAGECGGSAEEDECGVCGGDNSSCEDCAGVPNGDNVVDNCGTCDSDSSNDCLQDCNGDWGGSAVVDECGVCGGDGSSCGGIDYCLALHSGANLVSFYGLPDDPTIANVMSSIEGIATGVIGEGVASNYNESLGWLGSISTVSAKSGYWVIVTEVSSLCIYDAIPSDTAIEFSLHSGANLISFPAEGSVEIGPGLSDVIDGTVSGIISEGVASNYVEGFGWMGSISTFNGGVGYWMIATEPISFSFDVSTMSRVKSDGVVGLSVPEGEDIYQSTRQAFYFVENIVLDGESIQDGDWVMAYNENVLVGAREWNGAYTDIPVMGYDSHVETAGYLENSETPTFKVIRETTGEEFILSGNLPVWANNELYTVGVMKNVVFPSTIVLERAYPNPFNPVTNITFGIESDGLVSVKVFDVTGREIADLANGVYSAGYHIIDWDASNSPSGMYFLKAEFGGITETQKLMLLK